VAGGLFLLRAAAAFAVPMTGDEAYYWEWSRRLAFGYADHPPAVAWLAALAAPLPHAAGFARLPFVLCGVAATAALGAAAACAAGDRRAGAAAALLFALAPLTTVAFFAIGPDAPYLLAWCLGLWLAARACANPSRGAWVALGAALGFALLTRLFAAALAGGIGAYALGRVREGVRRGDLARALAVAALISAPFFFWNATHDWATIAFALRGRHVNEGVRLLRPLETLGTLAGLVSPGVFCAALAGLASRRCALAAWTALPLAALLLALASFERVEAYWFAGPFASACLAAGVACAGLRERTARRWAIGALVPAAALLLPLLAAAIAPGQAYRALAGAGLRLRNTGPFEVFTYEPLAGDVARLAAASGATVMTDGYGFSSVLDYDGGIAPVVIGYDEQGRESRGWYDPGVTPARALFVDKEPLATRPDFAARLARACGAVRSGPTLSYAYAGAPPRAYYLTWCDEPLPRALRILRWEASG
jgi:hypothetical protein